MVPSIETASSLAKSSAEQAKVIRSSSLERMDGLVHGFSTRVGGYSKEYGGGQLNLGFTASDVRATVERNRQLYLRTVLGRNAAAAPLMTLRQIHSGIVRILRRSDVLPENPWKGDGIVTNRSGVLLGIQVADCVPVLVADDEGRAIGAFHAGWRGTVKRIVQRGVGTMRALFGCRSEGLRAAIGPCIHQCCYAVGDEVIDEFQSQFTYADELFTEVYDRDPIKEKYPLLFLTARAPGHSNIGPQTHLDLVEANRRQLLDAGVPEEQIWSAGECTSCRTDLLFSHRAESGYTGRMMAVIGMK